MIVIMIHHACMDHCKPLLGVELQLEVQVAIEHVDL